MRGIYLDPRHEQGCPAGTWEPDPLLPERERQRLRRAARLDARRCRCSPSVRVKVGGRWVHSERWPKGWTAASHREPLEVAMAAKRERERTGVEQRVKPSKAPTLRAWGEARLEAIQALCGDDSEAAYSPATFESYSSAWRANIANDEIANKLVTAITAEDLNLWMSRCLARGRQPSYVKQMLRMLTGFFEDAREDPKIPLTVNPASSHRGSRRRRGVNVLRVPKEKRSERRRKPKKLLELDLATVLIASTTGVLHEMILVCLSTGLRLGELSGLEWTDIDFAARRIHVERQYGRHGERDPKYDQMRDVLLWSRVAKVLGGSRRGAEGPIFLDPDTGERFKHQKAEKLLNRAWEAIGPRPKGHSWHTLRHTYTSILDAAPTISRALMQETIGHGGAQDVTAGYVHQFNPAIDLIEPVLDEALAARLDLLAATDAAASEETSAS